MVHSTFNIDLFRTYLYIPKGTFKKIRRFLYKRRQSFAFKSKYFDDFEIEIFINLIIFS